MQRLAAITAVALLLNPSTGFSGSTSNDSVFGPLNFGQSKPTAQKNAPFPSGGYSRVESEKRTRSYVSSNPKGGMYLTENTIHNCKSTLHILVDRVRGPELESRIITASLENNLAVRIVTNEPAEEADNEPLQRLLRAGVEVKVTKTPILEPVLICDSQTVVRGVLEPYDKNRVSFGHSFTTATLESQENARPLEVSFQNIWAQSNHLPMSTEPGNRHWELFGAKLKAQNKAVSDYEEARLAKQYNHKPTEKRGFFEVPFELRSGTYGAKSPSESEGDPTRF